MTAKQRTRTEFLCLTITAGAGKPEHSTSCPGRKNYAYTVGVQSDATGARTRFTYHDSVDRYEKGIDHLDREALLYAFWSFCSDAASGRESFHDFAADFGWDHDSISAKRTWEACRAAFGKFNRLWHEPRDPEWVLEQLAHEGIE